MIKTPIIPFIYWLYSFLFLSVSSSAFSQNDLIFNELGSINGLEDSKTVFVYKDSRGFTWIGTLGSLYRFDGSEVLAYGSAKGVTGSYLQSSMFEDKRGNLWFCTFDKLLCYDRLRDTCLTFGGFKEKNGVETLADYGLIHLDKQDQLWLTAGGTIYSLNLDLTLQRKKLSFISYTTGKAKVEGKRFYPLFNQKGVLTGFFEFFLIGPGMKLWTKLSNRSFTNKVYFDTKKIPSTQVGINEVLPISGKNDQYFLVTPEDILIFNSLNEQSSSFFKAPPGLNFYFSTYLSPHTLLLSTNEGLYYLDIPTKRLFKAKDWSAKLNTNDLSRNKIRKFFLDRDSILWASVYDEGLCYTNPYLFKPSFTEQDLNAECWLELSQNEYLFGTLNGLYLVEQGEIKKHFLNKRITGLYKDLQKRIWVESERGLHMFDPTSKTIGKVLNDESYLLSFYQSSDGTYWVGSDRGVYTLDFSKKQKIVVNTYISQLLASTNIWEDTQHQRLYLHENVSNLHILQYRKGNWEKDTVFPIKGVLGGYLLPKGADKVWIATVNGIKLIHCTKATLEELSIPPTWPSTNITGMVQDQQGTIWVSTNTHILSFDSKGRPLRMYTPREGFLAGPFLNMGMKMLSDGLIGIMGKNGLNFFRPSQMNQKRPLPKIQITRLSVQGTPYQKLFPQDSSILEKKRIRLKYRQNSIALRLVGMEMGQPNQVKIQYYLKNWEKASEASIRNQFTEARYGKLNPGSYTLMVRAANANGEWTDWNAKLQIEVIPPYWMRWWFKLISILGGAMFVAGLVQIYFRAQLREARIRNEEQERILRDIHDLTSGKVVFFQDFQFFAEQEIPGTEAKVKALGIADQALQLFKRISAAVRNSTESDSTLLEFMQQLIAESKKHAGSNLNFSTKIDTSIPYAWVAGEYKRQLRLVVQEAIGNTLKHAQATSLVLNIEVRDGKLKMVLQDNGKGISESKIAQIKPTEKIQDSGNGLGNMLSRVKQIGGEIKWSNDKGTQVLISISLHKILPRRKIFPNFIRFLLF